MLLAFTTIIVIIGLGLTVVIYSVFSPFTQNIGDIKLANSAYYGAIGGLERGLLTLKFHKPGFSAESGKDGEIIIGNGSDSLGSEMGNLSKTKSTLKRTIDSKVLGSLPMGGKSINNFDENKYNSNYNSLEYLDKITLFLDIDASTGGDSFYTGDITFKNFEGDTVSGSIIIPNSISAIFGNYGNSNLCENENIEICDQNKDNIFNESIINRSIQGEQNGNIFKIIPTEKIDFSLNPKRIIDNVDNHIRENIINLGGNNISFSNGFSPIPGSNILSENNFIGEEQSIKTQSLSSIISDLDIKNKRIDFNIVDFIVSEEGNIYPGLEYQFQFCNLGICNQEAAGTHYIIKGQSRVGGYEYNIILYKPTNNDSKASEFTIIF